MSRVLLGVTGGIAAYKACELCRLLVKDGHDVVPLVTPGAERFVTAETFRALARRPPGDDVYLHLTRADLLVVAPCTANTLAKLAHGLADNVLTEAALAHRGPVLVAPAMNPRMWAHPATRANAETLRARGVVLVGPDEGETAEGELGVGRMAEPDEILRARPQPPPGHRSVARKACPGLGRGHARAARRGPVRRQPLVGPDGRCARGRGAPARRRGDLARREPHACRLPAGVELVETPTAADLEREALARAPEADVVVMAAAVADYRPAEALAAKRPKDAATWTLELEPTTDVLSVLGERRRDGQLLVGFAAETGEGGLERARQKLARKGADLFVLNDVSRPGIGFDAPDNEVTLLAASGERPLAKAPKEEIAAAILDEVEALIGHG